MNSQTNIDALAIYVHFPWCVAKCPYCDFNSFTLRGELQEQKYLDALLADLQQEIEWAQGRPVSSVFLGGGTPSLFSPESIAQLSLALHDDFKLLPDAEITLEANPGAVEHGSFAEFKEAGITRLSIGAQSFANHQLQTLGRIHNRDATVSAVQEAKDAGLDNFNLDMMYGLPGQSVDEAVADIEQALQLKPTHISHYHLTLEPNTVFHQSPPENLPDDDLSWEVLTTCQEKLSADGYERYEVSAYAQQESKCRHNLQYWRYGDYLGVGAGAHGKITLPDGEIRRYAKVAHPREYMREASGFGRFATLDRVSADEIVFEFILNRTRLKEGFSATDFKSRTGLNISRIKSLLDQACERGLLQQTATGHWITPDKGFRFLDDLQQMFLPEHCGKISLLNK